MRNWLSFQTKYINYIFKEIHNSEIWTNSFSQLLPLNKEKLFIFFKFHLISFFAEKLYFKSFFQQNYKMIMICIKCRKWMNKSPLVLIKNNLNFIRIISKTIRKMFKIIKTTLKGFKGFSCSNFGVGEFGCFGGAFHLVVKILSPQQGKLMYS